MVLSIEENNDSILRNIFYNYQNLKVFLLLSEYFFFTIQFNVNNEKLT